MYLSFFLFLSRGILSFLWSWQGTVGFMLEDDLGNINVECDRL